MIHLAPEIPGPAPDWARWQAKYRALIIGAIDPRRYPVEWVEDQLRRGIYAMWANDEACILAAIRSYPTGVKDVEGIVAAGKEEAIIVLIEEALAWGRANRCEDGLIESRPGWAKKLKPFGWEVHQTTIRKAL